MARKVPAQPAAVVKAHADAVAETLKKMQDKHLQVLALELSLSASQVLREKYGFTPEQILEFQSAWLERAQANREIL
jgi:hypothetical protein